MLRRIHFIVLLSFILCAAFARGDGHGGLVGNGGDWVKQNFLHRAWLLTGRLRQHNPHQLDLQKLQELIDVLDVKVVTEPLMLRGRRVDAVNYLPTEKRVVLDRERWERHFALDHELDRLIYHELLPEFVGDQDREYALSRQLRFEEAGILTKNIPGVVVADAEIPEDLRSLVATVDKLVIPGRDQDEYRLSANVIRIESHGNQFVRTIALSEEMKFVLARDFAIERIESRSLYVEEELPSRADQILSAIWSLDMEVPYFCNALRGFEEVDGSQQKARCRTSTKEIFGAANESKREVFMILLDGDYYGTIREATFYIGSTSDPNLFVRLVFDVCHEI